MRVTTDEFMGRQRYDYMSGKGRKRSHVTQRCGVRLGAAWARMSMTPCVAECTTTNSILVSGTRDYTRRCPCRPSVSLCPIGSLAPWLVCGIGWGFGKSCLDSA